MNCSPAHGCNGQHIRCGRPETATTRLQAPSEGHLWPHPTPDVQTFVSLHLHRMSTESVKKQDVFRMLQHDEPRTASSFYPRQHEFLRPPCRLRRSYRMLDYNLPDRLPSIFYICLCKRQFLDRRYNADGFV